MSAIAAKPGKRFGNFFVSFHARHAADREENKTLRRNAMALAETRIARHKKLELACSVGQDCVRRETMFTREIDVAISLRVEDQMVELPEYVRQRLEVFDVGWLIEARKPQGINTLRTRIWSSTGQSASKVHCWAALIMIASPSKAVTNSR